MELCTPQTFSKLPTHSPHLHSNKTHLQWKPSLLLNKSPKSRFNSGLLYRTGSSIRSTSEESSSLTSQYVKETEAYELYEPPNVEKKDDGAVQIETLIEDSKKDKEINAYESLIYEPPKVEERDDGAVQTEAPVQDSPLDFQAQLPQLFDNLNIKLLKVMRLKDSSTIMSILSGYLSNLTFHAILQFDPEDSSSIFLLGGGAVVALWLTAAIVGAIDSIPLFPKLLEVVGLGYTLWFSTRYLIFKKNRDELAAKIEDLKQEVLGSNGD